MKVMSLKKIILGVCILLMSCNDEAKDEISKEQKLVNNIIDTYALPQQENFVKAAEDLKKASDVFLANNTGENLLVLQETWKGLAKSWARSFTFNIGDLRKSKYYLQKLAFFPVSKQAVEDFIKQNSEITMDEFNQYGSTSTGILSLGYLLYSDSTSALKVEVSKIVLEFKNSENRKRMLRFVVGKILKDAQDLKRDWCDYAKVLKNNKAKQGAIENSFSLLFNGINNVVNFAWETKVASPAGLANSAFNPKKVEAPYSKYSLELIKENIGYTKEIFFNEKGESVADAVKFVTKNNLLVDEVKNQYKVIEDTIDSFEDPLYDTLKKDFEKVKILEKELKKLQVLYKVDITSALSLVNTNTDGDGD